MRGKKTSSSDVKGSDGLLGTVKQRGGEEEGDKKPARGEGSL